MKAIGWSVWMQIMYSAFYAKPLNLIHRYDLFLFSYFHISGTSEV
jgi:hypothetical protein